MCAYSSIEATSSRSTPERALSLLPLSSFILRSVLRRSAALTDISVRSWTLCHSELATVPPAIYLKENLEKISRLNTDTSLELESRRIAGGKVEHAATLVHTVKWARLFRGTLYSGPWRHRLLERAARGPREQSGTRGPAALACTLYGSMFFGHWMLDDLSLHLAAESLDHPMTVARPQYRHEEGYRRLLNVDTHSYSGGVFDRMLVLQDFGQNSHKKRRYQELRNRLRSKLRGPGSPRVYIRRGAVGARQRRALVNGDEVERFLMTEAVKVIDPDGMSSEEVAHELAGAKLVIGTEGSHLAHALYAMAEDSVLFVLQPPYQFNNVFKDYTDCLGMRYAFVIGTPASGGFAVEIDDLSRALRCIEKQVRI